MTTKISLNSLKDSDYKALLENDKVVNKLIEFTTGSSAMIDDWLGILDGVSEYSLYSSDNYNYITVYDSYSFLKSVLVAQENDALLADSLIKKVKKTLSDYEDSEPLLDFEDKLDEARKQVVDVLVTFAKNEFDYLMSVSHLLEDMKDEEALIIIYGEDAYYNREDNKIYYTSAD